MEESVAAQSAPTGAAPVILLRVVVRAKDLDAFITRYSKHLQGDRIFIFTRTPQPIGTRVRFSLHLHDGEALIHGKGTVVRVQADKNDPRHPPGMELVFVTLDERSQTLVDFMHATRLGAVESSEPLAKALVPPKPLFEAGASSLTLKPLKPEGAPVIAPPPVPADAPSTPIAVSAQVSIAPPSGAQPLPLPSVVVAPEATAEKSIPEKLAEVMGPAQDEVVEPLQPGPAPQMAESWRDPLPPGTPAADPAGQVPANPFSEVSDGVIDYFVEWSIEQSIGNTVQAKASFSNVSMSLPAVTDDQLDAMLPPKRKLPAWALTTGGFAGGLLVGGLAIFAIMRKGPEPVAPPHPAPVAVAPAPAETPEPEAETAPAAKAAGKPAGETVTLAIDSRPPGASITVDGQPQGQTPATLDVTPGKHDIVLSKDRYQDVKQKVKAPGNLTIDLRRPSYTLLVSSMPGSAEVTVAGQPRGRAPVTVKLPGFEKYDVEVSMPGSEVWRRSVYLKQPSTSVVAKLALKKQPPRPGAAARR